MMKMTHIISIFAVMVAVLLSGCADNGKILTGNGFWSGRMISMVL